MNWDKLRGMGPLAIFAVLAVIAAFTYWWLK